jgi:hypothetical protein
VALVLPALVHAMCAVPNLVIDPAGLALAHHDMGQACALELVMATPAGQAWLPSPSPRLSARLANAAIRALTTVVRHPSQCLSDNDDDRQH